MGVQFNYPDGWEGLVQPLIAYCDKNHYPILGIKKQYGRLVFDWIIPGYMQKDDPTFERIVREAEVLSLKTCETCSKRGFQRNIGGVLSAVCDSCL